MNLDEVLNYRRSVRVYDKEKEIDIEKVKHCLELATLAPNSSDMQLWEFYHITQPELMAKWYQELVLIKKQLPRLRRLLFSSHVVTCIGSGRNSFLILRQEIYGGIVL